MLSLKFLGTPIVYLNDQSVGRFRSVKSLALLAYLAIEQGEPYSRDYLLTLLWPDLPEHKGRQNLSQTITRLRRTLGEAGAVVQATRQDVWLGADGIEITSDVDTFHRLLNEVATHAHNAKTTCATCQQKLAEAVALVRGDLLEGVTAGDSLLFDEWLLLERERLHQQLLGALKDLAEGSLKVGAYEAAEKYARRQVALEPWREVAHRQLIRALALGGRRNAALVQYEQCRTILREELGVEPTRQTQALATAVREGTLTRSPSHPPSSQNLTSNLPQPLTPFIGREAELNDIIERLTHDETARLLTITGQGGIGKTRLAQEVGRAILAHPPQAWSLEGVYFVSLVGEQAAEHVPLAIANVLELSLANKDELDTAVIQQLRSRRLLLILDNFELLLDSRPWLLALLQAAPEIRLLVTSREHLHLMAEHRFALRGLTLPPEDSPHTQALDYDASRLFIDRARRFYPDFRLTGENWSAVRQICQLTAGLPLGIELAVTLLETATPAEIVTQITADATTLAADYLDILPHHQSLYLVFEQSWARLSLAEQEALSRLQIFESNTFSRSAALHVAGAQDTTLHALVRKSLVQAPQNDLYALHPLYKMFAARKLTADHTAVRTAHATFFAHLLSEAVPNLFDKQKHLQMRSLLPLLPDLRSCWQWIVQTASVDLLAVMAEPLYLLLRETAQLQEGRALFEMAWEQLQTAWPPTERSVAQQTLLAYLSSQVGFFRLFCGDAQGARPCLAFALAEFDRLKLPHETEARGLTLAALTDILKYAGEHEAQKTIWQQELAVAEANGDLFHANRALSNLGEALHHMGQLTEAREILWQTLETAPANVPEYTLAITINNLGLTELMLGDLPQARVHLEQSLQIRQQYANTYRVAAAQRGLGLLALAEGDPVAARTHLHVALTQYQESGRLDGLGPVHLALAQVALQTGDFPTAEQEIRQALVYAVSLQYVVQGLNSLRWWGEYLWAVERHEEALQVLAYVLRHQNASGLLVREVDDFLAAQQISPDEITAVPVLEMPWQAWLEKL
ncbi:MAG: tetratricopeptide repeat protein [Anaerolineales bacterium]|nr:tetratricopeptide repeat protein [Anaerolineales bacterium]